VLHGRDVRALRRGRRRLDELWPGESETKTLLVNSGRRGVENAVKIARAATGRRGRRLRPRLPRPHEPDDGDDLEARLQAGLRAARAEVYRAPAPYPYRGVSVEDALAGSSCCFKQDVAPDAVACVVLETVQGEGGFIPMPAEFVRR
jgi:4-aminobutyrate aminotransferase-like enzyme